MNPALEIVGAGGERAARPKLVTLVSQDLGTVLADGAEIEAEFVIANPGGEAMELVGAEAMTPCCSHVESWPERIAPGAEGMVRVALKPGFDSGRKGVSFLVRTAADDRPNYMLRLETELVSAWSVELGEHDGALPVGRGGAQEFMLKSVRGPRSGRSLPMAIEATGGVRVLSEGTVESEIDSNGLEHARRVVTVALPASAEVGTRRAGLAFRWEDGRTAIWPVIWNVEPAVTASPNGFVIDASTGLVERTVVVRAGRPFRVVGVRGARPKAYADVPTPERPLHVVPLLLDADMPGFRDVVLELDHPDQDAVSVSIQVREARP